MAPQLIIKIILMFDIFFLSSFLNQRAGRCLSCPIMPAPHVPNTKSWVVDTTEAILIYCSPTQP
jgi:hypothetical protein